MQNTNKQFGVVFVQMHVTDNKLWNIQHAERLIRTAVAKYQPKLVVLPEYFNSKWGKLYFEQFAEVFPTGETFIALQKLAKELNIYLVGGSIPERDTKNYLYNTTTVFAPTGSLIAKYRKIHLFDMEMAKSFKTTETEYYKLHETEYFKAGNELAYFDMDGVKIGLGIGYDISFSELAHLYRQQGVEMIIYPTIFPTTYGYQKWEQLNRVRAIDNQMYVLGVSQARNDTDTEIVQYGHSMLVDYYGRVVARAGEDEEFIYAHLDFVGLEQYRLKYDLFAHKRSDVYETLYKKH